MKRNVMTVYVAEKRYTFEFMKRAKYFTVMKIDGKVLAYMGKNSGRDRDKTKSLGLHIAYTTNGTPYYTEATEVYECEIMYSAPFNREGFRNNVPEEMYKNFPAGIHSMYFGDIVGA